MTWYTITLPAFWGRWYIEVLLIFPIAYIIQSSRCSTMCSSQITTKFSFLIRYLLPLSNFSNSPNRSNTFTFKIQIIQKLTQMYLIPWCNVLCQISREYWVIQEIVLRESWAALIKHKILLSDCSWTRTQNQLVRKWTLNHLAELRGSGFESSCSHLNFRLRACFEQRVPWHSGNCSVDSLWNVCVTW